VSTEGRAGDWPDDGFDSRLAHMSSPSPVGVIGGSGLYSLFGDAPVERTIVATPYGVVEVTTGEFAGRPVVFLPRHGVSHTVAPHLIGYRANIWALASLGVTAIVSSAAVGGLSEAYPPGTLLLPDQFIDRTWGRADTFYDRDSVQHLPAADPFCPALRASAIAALEDSVIGSGTVAVIQGPRFSTRAESSWLRAAGADVVNMTLSPEVPLAAELNIGTVTLAYVTDTDAAPAEHQLTAELVFSRFAAAQPRILDALDAVVASIPDGYTPRTLIDQEQVDTVLRRDAAS
jgi:5'-methylthioadenosine phosphorylase